MEPLIFINNMHIKAQQHQPFHCAKRKLHPALTAVITRSQYRDASHPGRQPLFNVAVTGTALGTWTHAHGIPGLGMLQSSYPSVESVRERDSTCKRHLACAGQHEGLLHILWDCVGASKMWAYIITQWTRTEVSPAQMVLYKQAALSRSDLSYLRVCRRLSSKCSQTTLTSLAEPGKEYGGLLALYASPRSGHSGTAAFIRRKMRLRSKR